MLAFPRLFCYILSIIYICLYSKDIQREVTVLKVGLLGFGTVGVGVYEMLGAAEGLEQGPVLVRKGKDAQPFQVTDIDAVLSDGSVGAVVEVMGGIEPAFTYAMAVLKSGKHLVTANKALVAAHGIELAKAARDSGSGFLFSAACGGGVPLLHNLSLAAAGDEIRSVSGILNGTTNYMLHAMQSRGLDYAAALKEAQALGYAEADPTADVSGLDAARKILLAAAVAFSKLPDSGLDCEGIENFTLEDVEDIRSRGLTCRLLAECAPAGSTVSAFVEPALLPAGAAECAVVDNYNMARYVGKNCGPMTFMGQGAGRYPTASAVIRDLGCLLRGHRMMMPSDCVPAAADNSREQRRYYVRLRQPDASALPLAELLVNGSVIRAITEPLSVRQMHAAAEKIRKNGGELFFAAMEG